MDYLRIFRFFLGILGFSSCHYSGDFMIAGVFVKTFQHFWERFLRIFPLL